MSTPLPLQTDTPAAPSAATASRASLASPWLREPLLHFVLLGAVLFGLDHALVSRQEDPRVIVVSAEVDKEAKQLFAASRGREPNADELKALRAAWLDNEVLYREGLAMQVDRGDSAIRERVIFKALSVVDANTKPPALDDKRLREWFEARRTKYDEPPRFDFQEAVLSGTDTSEAAVRAFVDMLNKGTPGEVAAGLRVFKGRPQANLVQSYGADFPKALQEAPTNEWRAVASRDGWRAIRLEGMTPGKAAQFEALRGVVLQDWTDTVLAEQRTAAVRKLAAKYVIKFESESK